MASRSEIAAPETPKAAVIPFPPISHAGFISLSGLFSRHTWLGVAALLLFGFHIVALAIVGPGPRGVIISDCFQLAVALLTTGACFSASRRSLGFSRSFWFVLTTAFFIWSMAEVFQIFLDCTVRSRS